MWQREQADRCSSCGTWPWEWDRDLNAYTPDTTQCLGCLKLDSARASETRRNQGIHIDLVRRPDGTPQQSHG
jgi:hypothetical protein